MEHITELPFLLSVWAHFQTLLQIIDDDNLGLLVVHLWTQVAAVGIFALALFARRRFWHRGRVEATIVGLDFSARDSMQPVCEYTQEDGTVVRARFLYAYPSYETGHKTGVFIDKNAPGVVMTGMTDYLICFGGLLLLTAAAMGGYQSYLMYGTLPGWLMNSVREVALTEVCLLLILAVAWPLVLMDRKSEKKRAAKLMTITLHQYHELDGKKKLTYWGTLASRMMLAGLSIYIGFGIVTLAYMSFDAYMHNSTIPVQVTETKLIAGYRDNSKPYAIHADWQKTPGAKNQLVARYPSVLIARKPLAPGDTVKVRISETAKPNPAGFILCEIDCGLPLAVLGFLLLLFGCAVIFTLAACFWVPRKEEKIH